MTLLLKYIYIYTQYHRGTRQRHKSSLILKIVPGVKYLKFNFPHLLNMRNSERLPLSVLCESKQRTHLQWPLLKMSPTAGDETSRGWNPENGRRRDFGRRRHRQSGFQHTDRPRPSSPVLFNKDHNAGRESLSHLNMRTFSNSYYASDIWLISLKFEI